MSAPSHCATAPERSEICKARSLRRYSRVSDQGRNRFASSGSPEPSDCSVVVSPVTVDDLIVQSEAGSLSPRSSKYALLSPRSTGGFPHRSEDCASFKRVSFRQLRQHVGRDKFQSEDARPSGQRWTDDDVPIEQVGGEYDPRTLDRNKFFSHAGVRCLEEMPSCSPTSGNHGVAGSRSIRKQLLEHGHLPDLCDPQLVPPKIELPQLELTRSSRCVRPRAEFRAVPI